MITRRNVLEAMDRYYARTLEQKRSSSPLGFIVVARDGRSPLLTSKFIQFAQGLVEMDGELRKDSKYFPPDVHALLESQLPSDLHYLEQLEQPLNNEQLVNLLKILNLENLKTDPSVSVITQYFNEIAAFSKEKIRLLSNIFMEIKEANLLNKVDFQDLTDIGLDLLQKVYDQLLEAESITLTPLLKACMSPPPLEEELTCSVRVGG